MAKKKKLKKKPHSLSKSPISSNGRRKLAEVEYMLEREQFVEALEILESLQRSFPTRPVVWRLTTYAASHTSNPADALFAAIKWKENDPNDPEAYLALASIYSKNIFPSLAAETLRDFAERWPDHESVPKAKKTSDGLLSLVAKEKQYNPEVSQSDDWMELAHIHERIQVALNLHEYDEGIAACVQLIARAPRWPRPHNNLSLLYYLKGQLDKAIGAAKTVLSECDPQNVHAISNLIRFLCIQRQDQEVQDLTNQLLQLETPDNIVDVLIKKAEGLAYAAADEALLAWFDTLEESKATSERSAVMATIYQLAGVAAARLGRDKEAIRLLELALQQSPHHTLAKENLQDLKQAPGKREGAWPFASGAWLPASILHPILKKIADVSGISSERKQTIAIQAIADEVHAHPFLLHALSLLLERGAPQDRQASIAILRVIKTPQSLAQLKQFVLGPHGTDQARFELSELLVEEDLLPRNRPSTMWREGKQTEQIFFNMEVSYEPKKIPKALEKLNNDGIIATKNNDLALAETIFLQAQEKFPQNPMVMQNLASVYSRTNRKEMGKALVRQSVEIDPQYIVGRCQLAIEALRDGNVDEAKAWLEPVMDQSKLHISEFEILCETQAELLAAEKKYKAVQTWFQLWEQIEPDSPKLHKARLRILCVRPVRAE